MRRPKARRSAKASAPNAAARKVGGGGGRKRANGSTLSPHQREIFDLISQGFGNKEIADRLHSAVSTIAHHVAIGMAKLGAHTRTQAVVKYLRLRSKSSPNT